MYNMNKYFIEYPNTQTYVCFDGCDGYVNLLFKHNDKEYLFVEYVHKNEGLVCALKNALKLKDKNNSLNLLLCMILDQFNSEPKKDYTGEFKFTILPEKNKNVGLFKVDYPSIHIFTDDRYYNNTYPGNMMFNRLKKKLAMINFNF